MKGVTAETWWFSFWTTMYVVSQFYWVLRWLLFCRVRTSYIMPLRTRWRYFSTAIHDMFSMFDVLAKLCHPPDFWACCRWYRPRVARSDIGVKRAISGTLCVPTVWPIISGCAVIFPISVQCQHLDGCDCCHPDVVSLSFVVVAAASRANKLPRHYYI